jgi:hypothetical protein
MLGEPPVMVDRRRVVALPRLNLNGRMVSMSERVERLRHALAELESELQGLDSLDTETREILHRAAADIAAALNRETQVAGAPAAPPSVVEQNSLRERMVHFEATHPQLAALFSRVIDLLGQAGI